MIIHHYSVPDTKKRIAACKAGIAICEKVNPDIGIIPAKNALMKNTCITIALFDDLETGKNLAACI
jgi:hypothetical protein